MSLTVTPRGFRQRVVILGATGVGKTSIITRYLDDKFVNDYTPTVEELHTKKLLLNDQMVTLDIVDTSGGHEFPVMRELSLASADAFVLVYRLDDERSFNDLGDIRDEIVRVRGEHADIPTVVVGNMSDLGERCMDKTTTEFLVNLDWDHVYVETSAKDNINIDKLVDELILVSQIPGVSTPTSRRRSAPAGTVAQRGHPVKKKKRCVIS